MDQKYEIDQQQHENDKEKIKNWLDITNLLQERCASQTGTLGTNIRNHLKKSGYKEPAPIQKMVLPYLLQEQTPERFFYIKAPTGTGKTLSFVLPLIVFFKESYLKAYTMSEQGVPQYLPYALILVNQHPLLKQIRDDFESAVPEELKAKGLKIQHFDKGDDEANIYGQVLCGVPDKIRGLQQKKIINLSNIKYIVVDEADQTIIADRNKIVISLLKAILESGNVGFKMIVCGATIDHNSLGEYFKIELKNQQILKDYPSFLDFKYFDYQISLDNIWHYYYISKSKQDMNNQLVQTILDIMNEFDGAQIMIFFNEKVECEAVSQQLKATEALAFLVKKDYFCEVRSQLQGEQLVPRAVQQELIENFRSEKKKIMLCSDLMGRGMNFRKVRLVINYGVPRFSGHGRIELRKYDQRVGRTGRMEDRGMALTLFNPDNFNDDISEHSFIDELKAHKIIASEYLKETFLQKMADAIKETELLQKQGLQ